MAFTPSTFVALGAKFSGAGPRVFHYITPDDNSTVISEGYFTQIKSKYRVSLYDFVLCFSTYDVGSPFVYAFNAFDENGNGTVDSI